VSRISDRLSFSSSQAKKESLEGEIPEADLPDLLQTMPCRHGAKERLRFSRSLLTDK
jgi:hypothetical protein